MVFNIGHIKFLLLLLSSLTIGITKAQSLTDSVVALNNAGGKLTIHLKKPGVVNHKGVIVVLPGWKLPVLDWCTKTALCEKALKKGYILIMPEMAKSIYANYRYPETRKDWLQFATREWFKDTLIRYFQDKYKLLLAGQNNFILGLSTGARGVALLCLECPEIFRKGAALSGDYDQTQMPNDALMAGWYGPYNQFPERWTGPDNIISRFKELKTPLYLAHGMADKIVPPAQTIQLVDSLKTHKPSLVKWNYNPNAGHDYPYWNSEVDAVLDFFNEQ